MTGRLEGSCISLVMLADHPLLICFVILLSVEETTKCWWAAGGGIMFYEGNVRETAGPRAIIAWLGGGGKISYAFNWIKCAFSPPGSASLTMIGVNVQHPLYISNGIFLKKRKKKLLWASWNVRVQQDCGDVISWFICKELGLPREVDPDSRYFNRGTGTCNSWEKTYQQGLEGDTVRQAKLRVETFKVLISFVKSIINIRGTITAQRI